MKDQKCANHLSCQRDATMAVKARIRRPHEDLVTEVFWDHTDAPKGAQHLCGHHGMEMVQSMARVLTADDREREDEQALSAAEAKLKEEKS